MSVEQSGNITRGHLAKWISSGVIGDAGVLVAGQRTLGFLQNADFNSTNDQIIAIPSSVAVFHLSGVFVTNASIPLTNAVGGFYNGPSKSGSAIVLASQTYSTLTTPDLLLQAPLTNPFGLFTRFSANNMINNQFFLSLTTPQGAPCSADVYIVGFDWTI